MSPNRPSKRLLIFCDGTWCGRETKTDTNIRIIADMVGRVRFSKKPSEEPTKVHRIDSFEEGVTAGYQEGVGVNKTFLEYLFDGATASTIGEECTSVYKFIVEHYTSDHEIWMFGFSRGAFTARCVAGMINNCGIIKHQPSFSDSDTSTLCREVYRTYRSPLDVDHPKSTSCNKFREDNTKVWATKRPVRLMILGDTVGSLGIPRLNAGVGFDWPEFYDQKVSTVVQEMYHAPSLHDRLWMFQPCLAFNGPGNEEVKIHQVWFPGCHYDLGRQVFRFVRQAPSSQIEKTLGAIPAILSKTIYPNEVLSDVLLRWMLQALQQTEANDQRTSSVIPNIEDKIQATCARLAHPTSRQPTGPTGSGDVYGNPLEYVPGGSIFGPLMKFGTSAIGLLNKMFPKLGDNIQDLLGIKMILSILMATSDRRIPGDGAANIYQYQSVEEFRFNGLQKVLTVQQQARIKERNSNGTVRYPSQTFENFELWRRVFGG